MRRSFLFAVLTAIAACSDVVSSSPPNDDAGATENENENDDGDEEDKDASVEVEGKKDAGKKDSGKDSGKDADANDGSIDTTPLACVAPNTPAACPNGTLGTFTSQSLPSIANVVSTQLRFDPGGFLHAAWPDEGVAYMTNRSGAFAVEHVWQPSGLPKEKALTSRLALDDCGRPIVLYRTQYQPAGTSSYVFRVFLATKVTGGWVHEEVVVPKSESDPTPATDFDAANLAVDGDGVPIIVTTRYSDHIATIARPKAGGGFALERTTIASSSSNLPVVAWSSTLGVVLGYAANQPAVAWKSGGAWTGYVVPGSLSLDSFTSNYEGAMEIAASPDGRVHAAWRSYPTGGRVLRYASIAAANGWTTPAVVPLPSVNMPTAITVLLPSTGGPRIAFDQFDGSQVRAYISRSTAGVFATAPAIAVSSHSGSALDANGREHLMTFGYSGSTPVTKLWVQNCAP